MHFQKIFIGFFLFFCCINHVVKAQTPPIIDKIDKTSGTIDEIVTIRGEGFGNSSSDIYVLFGAAPASSIIDVRDTEIKVRVPAGATLGSITVINKTTHLTAYSSEIFTLSYDGAPFELSDLGIETSIPTPGTSLYNLCMCDFNLDGRNDIVTSDRDRNTTIVLQNISGSINAVSFATSIVDVGAKTRWVRCGDLNGDGLADLVYSASNTNIDKERIYVLKNTSIPGGAITFEMPAVPYIVEGSQAARVDIRDIDGDGLAEIVAADLSANGGVSVFKNISTPGGAISFVADPIKLFAPLGITNVELISVDIEDLNGDGLPEVLAAKAGKSGTYVFTNSSTPGNIAFGQYTTLDALGSTTNIKVADLDNDQKPDVVVATNDHIAILKNTTGSDGVVAFANPVLFDRINLTREGLEIADIDGNGKPDILVGNDGRIVVSLNNSTESGMDFNTKRVIITSKNSKSVRAGDLNGDGKPDIAYTGIDNSIVSVYLNRNCIDPVLEPQGGLGVCDVFPYQLTVTKAVDVDYVWEISSDGVSFSPIADAVDSTGSYTASSEAFYRVQVTSSHNGYVCNEVSNAVEIARPEGSVPSKPVILNKDPETPYCFGETIYLSAASVNASYVWTGPNGFTSSEQNPVITSASAAYEGEYVLYVQASEANGGCVSDTETTYIKVSEPTAIEIQINSTPVFFEGSKRILSVAEVANNIYAWKKDGQPIAGVTTHQMETSEPGTYMATIRNELGCERESAPVTLAFAVATIPEKGCVREDMAFQITPDTLADQPVTYRWLFGDGKSAEGATVSHQYTTAGTFTVTVAILDATGAEADQYTQDLVILDLPVLTLTAENNGDLCPGETLKLTGTEGFQSYAWSNGETSPAITVSEAGTYSLTVTASSGCTSTKEIIINPVGNPDTTISAETDRISLGDSLQLAAPTAPGNTYAWSPASSLSDSTISNPIAHPLVTTTYTCTITNAAGCQISTEFTVTVDRSLDVAPQKVFTPNDDGKNDTWFVERMELYPDCRLMIFNRQGIKLLDVENYSNENSWNGYIKGRPAPAGVYFYLIDCGKEAGSQKGSITIAR